MTFKHNNSARYIALGKYSIELTLNIATNKELSEETGHMISDELQKMAKTILRNAELNDTEVIEDMKKEKEDILKLFGDSRAMYVKTIPNEYLAEKDTNYFPWFLVYTYKGPIKIGWRKRVISIDWTDSDIKEKAEVLFPDEVTTKSRSWDKEQYIHAWSYDKAQDYINKLFTYDLI